MEKQKPHTKYDLFDMQNIEEKRYADALVNHEKGNSVNSELLAEAVEYVRSLREISKPKYITPRRRKGLYFQPAVCYYPSLRFIGQGSVMVKNSHDNLAHIVVKIDAKQYFNVYLLQTDDNKHYLLGCFGRLFNYLYDDVDLKSRDLPSLPHKYRSVYPYITSLIMNKIRLIEQKHAYLDLLNVEDRAFQWFVIQQVSIDNMSQELTNYENGKSSLLKNIDDLWKVVMRIGECIMLGLDPEFIFRQSAFMQDNLPDQILYSADEYNDYAKWEFL